jgi:hypothetical protein
MRTKTFALLIAILLVLGISVAALAQPRGDPPRNGASTPVTTTERTTPPAPVRTREHQPVHHPELMNDQARHRVGDHAATCAPDQNGDRDRAQHQDRNRDCTPRSDHGRVGHPEKGEAHRRHSAN